VKSIYIFSAPADSLRRKRTVQSPFFREIYQLKAAGARDRFKNGSLICPTIDFLNPTNTPRYWLLLIVTLLNPHMR